jgi:hypothetical protein
LQDSRKLLACHADIIFSKICLAKGMTPKYATAKCTGNIEVSRRTKQKSRNYQDQKRNTVFTQEKTTFK